MPSGARRPDVSGAADADGLKRVGWTSGAARAPAIRAPGEGESPRRPRTVVSSDRAARKVRGRASGGGRPGRSREPER